MRYQFPWPENVVVLFGASGNRKPLPLGPATKTVAGAKIAQVVGAHPEEQLVAVDIFVI